MLSGGIGALAFCVVGGSEEDDEEEDDEPLEAQPIANVSGARTTTHLSQDLFMIDLLQKKRL